MNLDNIVCGNFTATSGHSLIAIVDALHVVLLALKARAEKESEDVAKLEALNLKLKEATAKAGQLEEEKLNAEKRSDLYKKRFLDAQKAIQTLHEKNVQLSSSQKSQPKKTESVSRLLFQGRSKQVSMNSKEIILAPNTCETRTIMQNQEVTTCLSSSDDEEFQDIKSQNPDMKVIQKKQLAAHRIRDGFFEKPKSPVFFSKRIMQRKAEKFTDMDETRLDAADPLNVSSALTDSELEKLGEEMDSKPVSPVLSADNRCSFQRQQSRGNRSTSTRLSNSQDLPLGNDNIDTVKLADKMPQIQFGKKETDNKAEESILHDHQGSPTKKFLPDTSLDELFDKTYGELETTKMLEDGSSEKFKDNRDIRDETDDEVDALLVGDGGNEEEMDNLTKEDTDMNDFEEMPERTAEERLQNRWDNSFDVLPRKEKNYMPNDVIRKKDEREKLNAKACGQCDAYYRDLPEEERRNVMRKVCRHKHVASPPSSPEHFWEIGIPSTAECRKRGYITDVTSIPPQQRQNMQKWRRKRPLQPYSNKKT